MMQITRAEIIAVTGLPRLHPDRSARFFEFAIRLSALLPELIHNQRSGSEAQIIAGSGLSLGWISLRSIIGKAPQFPNLLQCHSVLTFGEKSSGQAACGVILPTGKAGSVRRLLI